MKILIVKEKTINKKNLGTIIRPYYYVNRYCSATESNKIIISKNVEDDPTN